MIWLLFSFILSGITFQVNAATIGSDSSVNRFNTQQLLNPGDRVAGFAALQGGFELASMDTTATFDSVFPVSGNIELTGGTLILNQDLIFADVSSFVTLGNIRGNNHVLELATSMTCIPNTSSINFGNCNLTLITSLAQQADVNTVSWSWDDRYIAIGLDQHATGDGNELRMYSFDGTSLALTATFEMGVAVQALDWHPSQYYLAVGRDMSTAQELLVFQFTGTILNRISAVEFGANVMSVSYSPTGTYLAVGTQSNAAELVLYPLNVNGTLNTGGAVTVNLTGNPDAQAQALDWNATSTYLAIGWSVTAAQAELQIYQLTTAPLGLVLNASIDFGNAVTGISWNPSYPNVLAVGLNSLSPFLRLYRHNGAAGTLTNIVNATTNLATPIRILDWRRGGECLALGKDVGVGGELRTYNYDDMAVTLSLNSDIAYADSVRGVSWSHSGEYLAVGTDTNVLEIYSAQSLLPDFCFTFSDLNVMLSCNTCFQNCCITFAGNSVINGQGNVLDIGPTCTVIVDRNASLLVKDIIITGVSGNQISAVDGTSTYSFQDVQMILDGNYSFTVGRFDVVGDLEIIGNGRIFAYRTDQLSTVSTCGRMILDTGVTFSYDPRAASQTLFQLADNTAQLVLNGATLHTTGTGLRLTKGNLVVDGNSYLSAESSAVGLGIRFGDGVIAANNLCIEILPAATLQVLRGLVENNNV
jgi:WD40 repeat protein